MTAVLEGKLGDFSLPDIFQLIALTGKSGALLVTSTDAQGRILFNDGEVCYAVADVKRVAIGARLVQAGLATEEEILHVLETKRSEGFQGSLAQALLQSVEVDEAELDLFMRSQIEDAVFDLLRLTEATFTFDASVEPDTTVGMTVSTEHLIVEGGRRLAEWSAIREHIPGSEVVLVLSPNAGATEGRVSITAAQWHVLTLVDGRRTVADIVDLSGQGEFNTSRLLAGMAAQGLVEVFQTPDGQTGAFSDMLGRRYRLRRIEELELGAPSRSGSRTDRSAAAAAAASGSRAPLIPQQRRGPVSDRRSASEPRLAAGSAPVATVRPLHPETAKSEVQAAQGAPQASRSPAERAEGGKDAPDEPREDEQSEQAEQAEQEPKHAVPAPRHGETAAQPAATAEGGEVGEEDPSKQAAPVAVGANGNGGVRTGSNGTNHVGADPTQAPPSRVSSTVDRAQVARELASLGLGADEPVAAPRADGAAPSPVDSGGQQASNGSNGSNGSNADRRLTRDEDVNKGLLLRLIDGVKGA
jgi:hypothetical protein